MCLSQSVIFRSSFVFVPPPSNVMYHYVDSSSSPTPKAQQKRAPSSPPLSTSSDPKRARQQPGSGSGQNHTHIPTTPHHNETESPSGYAYVQTRPLIPTPVVPSRTPHPPPTAVRSQVAAPGIRARALLHAPADTRADSPLVSHYGYIINLTYSVLICPSCGVVVNPSFAREHIVRKHKTYDKPPKDFNASVANIRPALTYTPPHPTASVPIIFGLKPPSTEQSIICPDCKHGYAEASYSQVTIHRCSRARQTKATAIRSRVQRFSMDTRHSWFPVHSSVPYTQAIPDVFELYSQQQATIVKPDQGPIIPENYRNLEQFVARENWPALLGSDPLEVLLGLTRSPTSEEGFGQLTRQVHVYLDQFQAIIKAGMPFSVRRDLGTRPSPERQTSYVVHHKDVQQDSLVRYARSVARLLAFVMRAQKGIDDEEEIPAAIQLAPNQLAAARRLRHLLATDEDVLRHSKIAYQENNVPESDPDADDDEEEDDQGQDDAEDLGGDDDIHALGQQSRSAVVHPDEIPIIPKDNMPSSTMSRYRCPNVTQAIFALLYTLFTQIPRGQQNRWHNPLSLFIPYSSRHQDGTYIAPGQLTHVIAALTFTARICMFTVMHAEVSRHVDVRYSDAFTRLVSCYLDETHESIIPAMYHLHRGLASLSISSFATPAFNAPDRSGTSIQVEDKIIHFSAIKEMVQKMCEEIGDDLQKLTFGLGPCSRPAHIYDSPRETKAGYSFLDDPSNPFASESTFLLRSVLSDRVTPVPYFLLDSHDKVLWLPGPCYEYVNLSFDVMMKLFVVTHITSGSPGRGSELASQLLRNVAGGSIRSLFFLFNIFMIMGTHNKTSHIGHEDKNIVRAPWPLLVQHWLTMLVRVRPFVVSLQLYFRTFDRAYDAQYYIYYGVHRPVNTSDLSKAMALHTKRHLGVRITLKLWRHIMSWIVADNSSVFLQVHLMTEAVHLGFGHLATTASGSYASDTRLPLSLDKTVFFKTLQNGGIWQSLLDLGDELLQQLTQGDHHRNQVMARIRAVLDPTHLTGASKDSQDVSHLVEHAADRALHLMLPRINATVNRALAHAQATFLHNTLPLLQESTILPAPPILVDPVCSAHLSQHRGQESTFRALQGQATQVLYSNNRSLLYITPTGSGKTEPIILATRYNDRGRCTVLFLPLKSMHEQYKTRASLMGITCARWTMQARPETHPQWLIVQVDHANPKHHTRERLHNYLVALYLQGRMSRIVVDEAHIVLTHSYFRDVMSTLTWLATLGANIVALTATLPPACEKQLMESLGCPIYQVLRAPVSRPNIKYSVVHTPVDPFTGQSTLSHHVCLYYTDAKATLAPGEVIIIFCRTKSDCETVGSMLHIRHYHAECSPEHLADTLDGLRSGKYQGVVATSLLSVGFDIPGVRYVIHYDCPRNALDYEQETGRAGRDGELAYAVVFVDVERKVTSLTVPDVFGEQAVRNTVRDNKTCRRLRRSHVLDGVGVSCPGIPGAVFCDVCEARRNRPDGNGFSPEYPPDLVTPVRLRREAEEDHAVKVLAKLLEQPAPDTPFPVQVAAAMAVLQNSNKYAPSKYHPELPRIHHALETLATSCIVCWALDDSRQVDHMLPQCKHGLLDSLEFADFCAQLDFATQVCWACGCPQRLVYVSAETGQLVRVHDGVVERTSVCHWTHTLKPLAFLCYTQDVLRRRLTTQMRDRIDDPNVSFASWLSRGELDKGLNNILLIFLAVLDLRGPPETHHKHARECVENLPSKYLPDIAPVDPPYEIPYYVPDKSVVLGDPMYARAMKAESPPALSLESEHTTPPGAPPPQMPAKARHLPSPPSSDRPGPMPVYSSRCSESDTVYNPLNFQHFSYGGMNPVERALLEKKRATSPPLSLDRVSSGKKRAMSPPLPLDRVSSGTKRAMSPFLSSGQDRFSDDNDSDEDDDEDEDEDEDEDDGDNGKEDSDLPVYKYRRLGSDTQIPPHEMSYAQALDARLRLFAKEAAPVRRSQKLVFRPQAKPTSRVSASSPIRSQARVSPAPPIASASTPTVPFAAPPLPSPYVPDSSAKGTLTNDQIAAIRRSFDTMRHICVRCWAMGDPDYSNHITNNCQHTNAPTAKNARYRGEFRFNYPNYHCFRCGCPYRLTYVDDEGISRGLHNALSHPSQCLHVDTLRPLAWVVTQDDDLRRRLVASRFRGGVPFTASETANQWVPLIQPSGLSNIIAILQVVIELRGVPTQ